MNKLFSHKGLLIERGGSTSSKVGWVVVFILLFVISYSLFVSPAHASRMGISKPGNNLGLVGWWTFDGKDTVWTSPAAATTLDKSGKGNTGTLTNMSQVFSPVQGKVGQALNFDGVDDEVVVPSSTIFDFSGSNYSISLWVNLNKTQSSWAGIIAKGTDANNWAIQRQSNTSDLVVLHENNSVTFSGLFGILSGTGWNHLVITYNTANNTVTAYLNGVSQGTGGEVMGGDPVYNGTHPVKIGASRDDLLINGKIDDIRIYNRVLSVTEVKAQYNSGSTKFSTPNNGKTALENGLVGHWTFDGKDMPLGKVMDTSGNVNHGSSSGMSTSTQYVQGKLGQALKFDGINDEIGMGDVIDIITPRAGLTLSVWVNPRLLSSAENTMGVIDKFANNGNYRLTLDSNGQAFFWIRDTASQSENTGSTVGSVVVGRWTHIVATFDDVTTGKIYINGVLENTKSNFTLTRGDPSNANFVIGRAQNNAGSNFNGQMDDVRVYNRALSATEIIQLYNLGGEKIGGTVNSGKPSQGSGFLGHWTFDGKDMPLGRVLDVSGQGKHGFAMNMATSTMYVPGRLGQALLFDGVNDRVQTSLSFTGLSQFTVSQWVYAKNPDQYDSMWSAISTDNICNSSSGGEGLFFGGPTSIYFRVASDLGNNISVPNIKNKWTHVVSVYSPTVRKVYFDNVLVYNQASVAGPTVGTVNFQIGDYNNCVAPPAQFEGMIDDTRVYNRVLSTTEIQQLYNMGK